MAEDVEVSLQLLCVADRYGIVPLKHHLVVLPLTVAIDGLATLASKVLVAVVV